jgi:archaetidylinositol phosphate synthase
MEHVVMSIGAACVASLFLLYLGRRASPTKLPRSQGQLLPAVFFDFGQWVLAAVIPTFRYLRVSPNALSFVSLPACLCAAATIASGHFGFGGIVLIVAFSLDAWDGALARSLAIASEAGEVVDAMIDRYNDVIIMLAFLYYFRDDVVSWLIAAAALVGTVAVSYVRAKGASLGIDPNFGCMQRHERAVWLSVATLVAPSVARLIEEPSSHPAYLVVVVTLGAVAIGTNVTALRRAWFVVTVLEERRRGHREEPTALSTR